MVWACGAWLASLFPDLVPLHVTRQDLFYFDCGEAWDAGRVPAWVDYDRSIYGVGRIGHGFKVAPDFEGPPFDPESRRANARPKQRGDRARLREGAVPGARRRAAGVLEGCPYSLTPDTHFLLAPHPGLDGELDLRRRVGPRLQARPRARGVRGAGDRRRGGARRAVRARPARARAEPPDRRTQLNRDEALHAHAAVGRAVVLVAAALQRHGRRSASR